MFFRLVVSHVSFLSCLAWCLPWCLVFTTVCDLATAHVPVTAHRERQRPATTVVDIDPHVAERLDHRSHGSMQRALALVRGAAGGREQAARRSGWVEWATHHAHALIFSAAI